MDKCEIQNVLLKIGISSSLKGFRYITDAILLLDTEEWKDPYWTDLYRVVGEMNQTTAIRTERAIRHAFYVCRKKCLNVMELEYYIGVDCTNSGSLSHLYTRMIQEEEQKNKTEEPLDGDDIFISRQELRALIREEVINALNQYKTAIGLKATGTNPAEG